MQNELFDELWQYEQQLKQTEKALETAVSSKTMTENEVRMCREKLSRVRNSMKNTEARLSEFEVNLNQNSFSEHENIKRGMSNAGLIAIIILSGVIIAGIIILIMLLFAQNGETDFVQTDKTYKSTVAEERVYNNEKGNAERNVISDERIENIINSHTTDPNTKFGIYVKNLKTGYTYGYNEHTKLNSSAMSYLPIMGTAFWQADIDGRNLYNDTMTFLYEANGREKPNSKYDDGTYFSIMDYIRSVAAYGDNNRANLLVDYVGGFDEVADYMRSIGVNDTTVRNRIKSSDNSDLPKSKNITTAYDTVKMFEELLENSYIDDRGKMKQMMKMCDGNGNPSGVRATLNKSYDVSNYNAYNSDTYNEVASVTDVNTEVIIGILSDSPEGSADKLTDRSGAIKELFSYITENQFAK